MQKAEGNRGWCYYRVGREEKFRMPGFEKMLLTPMEVIAPILGKFGMVVSNLLCMVGGSLAHADGG